MRNQLKYVFFLTLVLLIITFKKAYCQSSRPSKEQTIAYLNEKLSLYSTDSQNFMEYIGSNSNKDYGIVQQNRYYSYKFFSDSDRCYVSFTGLEINDNHFDGSQVLRKEFTTKYKVPLDQISSIIIKNDTTYRKTKSGNNVTIYQDFKYKKHLHVKLKSASAVSHLILDGEEEKPIYSNEFDLYFIEGEANLLSKIKKALLNLKLVCPEPKKKDLFENE
ncbi:hypothetical protein GCM10027592_03300 [Spirosoma flavus]